MITDICIAFQKTRGTEASVLIAALLLVGTILDKPSRSSFTPFRIDLKPPLHAIQKCNAWLTTNLNEQSPVSRFLLALHHFKKGEQDDVVSPRII